MLGCVRHISTREYIFINLRANDLPIHKEEVERSIIDKHRALSGCSDPLVSRLFSTNAQIDLELEEKMEVKKYNLASHYGVDQTEITPEFVKTFDREKPRTIWYNSVKALDPKMKLHDAFVDWCSKSAGEIKNGIDLKLQSPNIIMCLLAMDGLNEVMPQTKGVKFTESVPYFACAKTSRQVVEAGLDWFIPLIRHHKEMGCSTLT